MVSDGHHSHSVVISMYGYVMTDALCLIAGRETQTAPQPWSALLAIKLQFGSPARVATALTIKLCRPLGQMLWCDQ
jgi:hypothetical protein